MMIFDLRTLFLGVVSMLGLGAFTQSAEAGPCESQGYDGSGYVVCTVETRNADLELFWRDDNGRPYRSFSNLSEALSAKGKTLFFAMNAGMYSDAFAPIGLYVENGRELRPLNTSGPDNASGPVPNFYKKPNGVFFIDRTGAHILPTERFVAGRAKAGKQAIRFATQSGPMLVINGALHSALIRGSTDRTRRSGVGVCHDGTIRLAISEGDVNFHDFALLFRDKLQCPNALFLDGGNGTGLYFPELKRNDRSWHGGYGPMFGLVGP
jgi:uncharacterized protein YigE (DUF2233 family)